MVRMNSVRCWNTCGDVGLDTQEGESTTLTSISASPPTPACPPSPEPSTPCPARSTHPDEPPPLRLGSVAHPVHLTVTHRPLPHQCGDVPVHAAHAATAHRQVLPPAHLLVHVAVNLHHRRALPTCTGRRPAAAPRPLPDAPRVLLLVHPRRPHLRRHDREVLELLALGGRQGLVERLLVQHTQPDGTGVAHAVPVAHGLEGRRRSANVESARVPPPEKLVGQRRLERGGRQARRWVGRRQVAHGRRRRRRAARAGPLARRQVVEEADQLSVEADQEVVAVVVAPGQVVGEGPLPARREEDCKREVGRDVPPLPGATGRAGAKQHPLKARAGARYSHAPRVAGQASRGAVHERLPAKHAEGGAAAAAVTGSRPPGSGLCPCRGAGGVGCQPVHHQEAGALGERARKVGEANHVICLAHEPRLTQWVEAGLDQVGRASAAVAAAVAVAQAAAPEATAAAEPAAATATSGSGAGACAHDHVGHLGAAGGSVVRHPARRRRHRLHPGRHQPLEVAHRWLQPAPVLQDGDEKRSRPRLPPAGLCEPHHLKVEVGPLSRPGRLHLDHRVGQHDGASRQR
eukprot:scaffold9376_cov85-Isochrysis_galbana.AAC.2